MRDKTYHESSSEDWGSGGGDSIISAEAAPKKKGGRKKMPERWTRLMHLDMGKAAEFELHPIEEDVELDRQKRTRGGSLDECEKRLLFHPKAFETAHGELSCDDWGLGGVALAKLGKKVTE
jgi:hypothetical protein